MFRISTSDTEPRTGGVSSERGFDRVGERAQDLEPRVILVVGSNELHGAASVLVR